MPATAIQHDIDLAAASAALEGGHALDAIRWADETFGNRLALTSSFGAQSAVMLHLATRVRPDIPVIWIDTGYLFPETYAFVEQLRDRLNLNLKVYQSPITPARMEATLGRLWEQGEDGLNQYDQLRKVEPMQRALAELGVTAWLAGLRRDQTAFRATLQPVIRQGEVYKVHPILGWSSRDVHAYLTEHDLPYHPLFDQGYASIGDTHSTAPITADADERSGRFLGLKQECGIHLPETAAEDESRFSSGL